MSAQFLVLHSRHTSPALPVNAVSRRSRLNNSALTAFGSAVLTLILAPEAFVARSLPRPFLRSHTVRTLAVASAPAPAFGAGLLEELVHLSGTLSSDELAKKVDAVFGQLTPEDLNTLQVRLTAAVDDTKPQLQALTGCIQACMEKRMEQAARDIDSLLMSSGDIDANIRDCLERQDSPLPMLAVLQMNIGKAKRDGLLKQEQALTFIFSKMNAELEEKVPLANRVLTRLLSIEEGSARRDLLRGHFSQGETGKMAQPDSLAGAIVQLVADVERQYSSTGGGLGGETREGTLKLIRGVALDAGVVIGEVYGDEEQSSFTEQLQPLFEALSKG